MASIPSVEERIAVGRVHAAYGIKGWVWVYSLTDPMSNIFAYQPWYICHRGQWQEVTVEDWREQGKGLVALLPDCADRNAAEALAGAEIWVAKSKLPVLSEGDYYWSDLQDLQVWTVDGQLLGQVHSLMETGANDVLVVRGCAGSVDQRERLIPWLPDHVVLTVDLTNKRLTVDWDADF